MIGVDPCGVTPGQTGLQRHQMRIGGGVPRQRGDGHLGRRRKIAVIVGVEVGHADRREGIAVLELGEGIAERSRRDLPLGRLGGIQLGGRRLALRGGLDRGRVAVHRSGAIDQEEHCGWSAVGGHHVGGAHATAEPAAAHGASPAVARSGGEREPAALRNVAAAVAGSGLSAATSAWRDGDLRLTIAGRRDAHCHRSRGCHERPFRLRRKLRHVPIITGMTFDPPRKIFRDWIPVALLETT